MRSKDDIGDRGEAIFRVRITQPCGTPPEALFRAIPLGEKRPTLDFMLELIGLSSRSAYCFVQVKTTSKGLKPKSTKLRVLIKTRDIERMVNYPGPTYIVGVDETTEKAYIISANESVAKSLPSIPLTHPLNPANLNKLWKEVGDYWGRRKLSLIKSVFKV